jgi:hypothetical protein
MQPARIQTDWPGRIDWLVSGIRIMRQPSVSQASRYENRDDRIVLIIQGAIDALGRESREQVVDGDLPDKSRTDQHRQMLARGEVLAGSVTVALRVSVDLDQF